MNHENDCELDPQVVKYLEEYYCILNRMIRGMTNVQLIDSISYNFIVQMIPHHQAAIEMSENILIYTENCTLQEIAAQIISEQTRSIENMQRILSKCARCKNYQRDVRVYEQRMHQIMQRMFSQMRSARSTNCVNCNFIREMIPHHEGAVRMSQTTLQFAICPQLRPILEAIITSQKRGICQMQQLYADLNCAHQ